jgi:hypothetical protein
MLFASLAGSREGPAFLLPCRIMIVCMYAWSGLHKFTAAYDRMYEATFTLPLSGHWPQWAVDVVRRAGTFSPWLELATAAALCLRRTRRPGVIAAVAVHLSILLLTGPAGTDINAVIWPWNLVMPTMVVVLFWQAEDFGWRRLPTARAGFAAVLTSFVFGVLPAMSIAEKWDRYLSFHLYSGTDRRLVVILDAEAADALPAEWRRHLQPSARESSMSELHVLTCALAELHVPPPGDPRHLLALCRKLAAMDFAARGRVIFYTDFPFRHERGWDSFTPGEIQQMRTIPPLRRKF